MTGLRLPYPGLRAFDRDESDLFFGRDGAVDTMIDRLAETRFLAVLGASGSGKSSLVRTGLLDGLELGLHPAGSSWEICDFAPGGKPFESLARSLLAISVAHGNASDTRSDLEVLESTLRQGPRSVVRWFGDSNLPEDCNLLLLVDQFEELFRFAGYAEREEAEAFVKVLIASATEPGVPIQVVTTMRSEYLGACALIPGLAEITNAGAYLTPRMSREECRAAIVGPARIVGADVEPALVSRMLNDLAGFAPWGGDQESDQLQRLSRRSDQLPVMQHVLNRLWRESASGLGDGPPTLTLAAYEELGGLQGALAVHGEELLASLSDRQQKVAELVFRALVSGESPELATRRPLRVDKLADSINANEEDLHAVINRFRADDCNFLRPNTSIDLAADTIIDISHESLIRQWPKLSEWVRVEARAANFWKRLSGAAGLYANREGDLLTGLDLANLGGWWDEETPSALWAARYASNFDDVVEFLERSRELADAQELREREHLRNERKRLQTVLAGVSALALVATGAAWWGFSQKRSADESRNVAYDLVDQIAINAVNRAKEDESTSSESKLLTVRDIEKNVEEIVLDQDEMFAEKRVELLLSSSEALMNSGLVEAALERLVRIEEIVQQTRESIPWQANQRREFRIGLVKARVGIENGQFADAERALDAIDGLLSLDAVLEFEDAALLVEYHYLRGRMLDRLDRYNELWITSENIYDIRALAENTYDAADSGKEFSDRQLKSYSKILRLDLMNRVHKSYSDRTLGRWLAEIDPKAYFDAIDADLATFENEANIATEGNRWRQLRAYLALAKSRYFLYHVNDSSAAYLETSKAVTILSELVIEDLSSSAFVTDLAFALTVRANIATELETFAQVEADLSIARNLLHKAKQGRFFAFGSLLTEFWVDYYDWQLREKRGEDSSPVVEQLRARWSYVGNEPKTDRSLFRNVSTIIAWVLLRQEGADDGELDIDHSSIIASTLGFYETEGLTGADHVYAIKQRQNVFVGALPRSSERLDQAEFLSLINTAIDEAELLVQLRPNDLSAISNLAYIYGTMAEQQAKMDDYPAQRTNNERALTALIPMLESYPDRRTDLRNSFVYARRIIEATNEIDDWESAAPFMDVVLSRLVRNETLKQHYVDEKSYVNSLAGTARAAAEGAEPAQSESAAILAVGEIAEELQSAIISTERQAAEQISDTTDIQGAEEVTVQARPKNWSMPTMLDSSWRTLTEDESAVSIERFAALKEGNREIATGVSLVRQAPLVFYADGHIVELEAAADDGPRIFTMLRVGDKYYSLDGTSPAIHRAKDENRLLLDTADQAASYIRFFTTYVHGEEGPFQIVESEDDIVWQNTVRQETKNIAQGVMIPFEVWKAEDDRWMASASLQYGAGIFHTSFALSMTGMIEMVEDTHMSGTGGTRILRDSDLVPRQFINGSRRNVLPQALVSGAKLPDFGISNSIERTRDAVSHTVDALAAESVAQRSGIDSEALHYLQNLEQLGLSGLWGDANELNSIAYELLLKDQEIVLAVSLSERAAELVSDNPYHMDTLGWGYVKLGRVAEGLSLLDAASRIDPEQVEILFHLGQAYRLNRQPQEARSALEDALAKDEDGSLADLINAEIALLDAGIST